MSPDGQQFLCFQLMQGTTTTAGAPTIGPDVPAGLMMAMHWSRGLKK